MSNPSRIDPCLYELSLVKRATCSTLPFQLEWVPDSLAIPTDFTQTMLVGLRGIATRDAVLQALEKRDLKTAERIRRTSEPRPTQLPPFTTRDPQRTAGLYLRPQSPDEVELARLEWRGADATVISVRAHATGEKWRLSIVDEAERGFAPPSRELMGIPTLGELLEVITHARLGQHRVSLIRVLLQRVARTDPPSAVESRDPKRALLRVSSPYYPMLADVIAEHRLEQEEQARAMALERATPADQRCPFAVRGSWDPLRISAWIARELTSGTVESLIAHLSQYEDAIGRCPSARTMLWLHAGVACERTGRFDAAVAAYEQGRLRGSRDLDQVYWLHNNAGYALNQLGRHDEASSLLAVAVDLAPEPHNAWKNLGMAWQGLGRIEAAAVAYGRAFLIETADRRALALLEDLVLAHRELQLHELPELHGLRDFLLTVVDDSR